MVPDRQALSVKDLLSLLPLGETTIRRLVNHPEFPKITVGRRVIIPKRQFMEWMDRNTGAIIALREEK